MLLKVHGPKVTGWLVKHHGHTVADEALNRAAFNAWRFAERYDESKGKPGGWFLRIAQRAALDILRREERHCHKGLEYDLAYDPADCDDDPDDDHDSCKETNKQREQRDRDFHQIVDGLPPIQQRIIRRDLANGVPVDPALLAEEFDSTVNSISSQRSKAIKTIRTEMVNRGHYPDTRRSQ